MFSRKPCSLYRLLAMFIFLLYSHQILASACGPTLAKHKPWDKKSVVKATGAGILGLFGLSAGLPFLVDHFRSKNCPQSLEDWKQFRESFKEMDSVATFYEKIRLVQYCAGHKSQTQFFENKDFAACMDPFLKIIPSYATLKKLDETNPMDAKASFPEVFLKEDLVALVKSNTTRLQEILAEYPGSSSFEYVSKFPEVHGENVFVIHLNREKDDLFLNIIPSVFDSHFSLNVMSRPKNPDEITQFYNLQTSNDGGVTLQSGAATSFNCASCHQSGYAPIITDFARTIIGPENINADEFVKNINTKFKAPRKTLHSALMNSSSPVLGPEDSEFRNSNAFAKCLEITLQSRPSAKKIAQFKNLMNCSTCHSDKGVPPSHSPLIGPKQWISEVDLEMIPSNISIL
jgi:hypothetical protein